MSMQCKENCDSGNHRAVRYGGRVKELERVKDGGPKHALSLSVRSIAHPGKVMVL